MNNLYKILNDSSNSGIICSDEELFPQDQFNNDSLEECNADVCLDGMRVFELSKNPHALKMFNAGADIGEIAEVSHPLDVYGNMGLVVSQEDVYVDSSLVVRSFYDSDE